MTWTKGERELCGWEGHHGWSNEHCTITTVEGLLHCVCIKLFCSVLFLWGVQLYNCNRMFCCYLIQQCWREWIFWQLLQFKTLMLGHGGSSAGSYLVDPTSPIPSHCAVIILFQSVSVHQLSWLTLWELSILRTKIVPWTLLLRFTYALSGCCKNCHSSQGNGSCCCIGWGSPVWHFTVTCIRKLI